MKSLVIFIVLLIICLPISFAKEISIPKLFDVAKESVSISYGKEVYFYAGSKLVAVNDEYKYQDRLNSDINSKSLPFGQEIFNQERFSFTGKELDQDLYYFGARYYDSNLGKFISIDPVKDNFPYIYVSNNPMNKIDPSGMDDMFGTADMMLEYEQSSPEVKAAFRKGFINSGSTGADFTPVVGDAKGIFDAIRGRDQFGPMNRGERLLCLFCLSEIKTGAKLRNIPKVLDLIRLGKNAPLRYVIEAAQRIPGQKAFREVVWQGTQIVTSIEKRGGQLDIYLTRNLEQVSDSAKGLESVIHLQLDELGNIDFFKYGTNVLESGRSAKTRTLVEELAGTNIADLNRNMAEIGNVAGDLDPQLLGLIKDTFTK